MSKKQNQKKKVTIKIVPGQAIFVADLSVMHHIAETYNNLASTYTSQQDKQSCYDVTKMIYEWSEKTYFNPESDYSDEEW
jgi:hypothetical protein